MHSSEPSSPREPIEAPTKPDAGPSPWTSAFLGVALTLGLSLWNLGYYPLWGDEADTVIFARGVWETGDTSAFYGDNLYAYRNGTLLEHLKNRATPPASYYFVAPLWGAFGNNRLMLRLPFVLCNVGVVLVVAWWLMKAGVRRWTIAWVLLALALNVSFLLYGRQCRYFSLATLLTVAGGFAYWYFDGSRFRLWLLTACLCLLAATHYLHFAAAAAALVADYALWQRKQMRPTAGQWAMLVVPTLCVVAALAVVYNPIGKHSAVETPVAGAPQAGFLVEKAKLLWWSLRDMNACEYGAGLVLAVAPLVFAWRRSWGLLRLWGACLIYVVVTTILSPQPVAKTLVADVRYLAPLIPALVALTVLTFDRLANGREIIVVPLAALCIFSNIAHKPWERIAWRSTVAEFVRELKTPRHVATTALADWLRANLREGASAFITPSEYTAEQIIAAPHVVYGWQLENPIREQDYVELDRIHFAGEKPVDWIIALGADSMRHVSRHVLPKMADRGFKYEPAGQLPVDFRSHTRPELIWHWFRDLPYDKTTGIFIFKLERP